MFEEKPIVGLSVCDIKIEMAISEPTPHYVGKQPDPRMEISIRKAECTTLDGCNTRAAKEIEGDRSGRQIDPHDRPNPVLPQESANSAQLSSAQPIEVDFNRVLGIHAPWAKARIGNHAANARITQMPGYTLKNADPLPPHEPHILGVPHGEDYRRAPILPF
jgi:hypothetical protein